MRGDLREKLAVIWGKHEKSGETVVTGVTRGVSGVIAHVTKNVTVVTVGPVTPQDTNGYAGYEGYASKIARPRDAGGQSELTAANPLVTGVGKKVPAVPCPADIAERAAIIAGGDGCIRAEADRRALAEHGLLSWQTLAKAHRAEIGAALDRLPRPHTHEALQLLTCTREFLGSPLFDTATRLGWSTTELFGIAPALGRAPIGAWGLITTLASAMGLGWTIEIFTEGGATLTKTKQRQAIWPRFQLNEHCVVWWECDDIMGDFDG